MQTVAPHTLRGIVHALIRRLPRSFHSHAAGRASASAASALRARRGVAPSALVEESLYPEARLLADDVRVICGGHKADRLGSARVEVAGGVHALLDGVGGEGALVVHDDVVRRADGALEPRVRLQVEVKVDEGRHAAVDDGARARVAVLVRHVRVRRVEARVVPFPADEDAQLRVVPRVLGVDALERLEDLRQLFEDHHVVLALCWGGESVCL